VSGLLIFLLVGLVVWLLVKWRDADSRLKLLERRQNSVEVQLSRLKSDVSSFTAGSPETSAPTSSAPDVATKPVPPPLPIQPMIISSAHSEPEPVRSTRERQEELASISAGSPPFGEAGLPPHLKPSTPGARPASAPVQRMKLPNIQWESFLGVKLFAWLGGLALFLGVAFFVRHAFEHNLISAQMRVAIGYCVGLGLIVGGLWMPRQRHVVTVQSLCATGVLILYANTFAANAHYHLMGTVPAFGVMSLVTVVAFLLAVRLQAQVVAVLGLLGGFLTPWLLRTGQDNPPGLFGYLALLDVGLIAVVLWTRWNYLVLLAGVATAVMQFGWVGKFFAEFKFMTALTVFTGFAALFTAGFAVAHRRQNVDRWVAGGTLVPALSGLFFAVYIMCRPYPDLAKQVWWLLGFVLVLDLAFVLVGWMWREGTAVLHAAGALVFLLMMTWTARYLKTELLEPALVFYLCFALMHAVIPLVLQRRRPSGQLTGWMHVFPSLALVLILVPLFNLEGPTLWVWPVVLLIDLVAIVLAVLTASLASILAVFLLTVLGTAAWIFQLPAELPAASGMLTVVGGFAVFFVAATLLAGRKVFSQGPKAPAGSGQPETAVLTQEMFTQMTSMAAVLPFLLLCFVIFRLPLSNPSSVFGLAALLVVLLLAVAWRCALDWLAIVSLGSVLLVEYVWHFHRFVPAGFNVSASWALGFSFLFLLFPFVIRRDMTPRVIPWIASALALPLHFLILYRGLTAARPDFEYAGLLPAALSLPCLAALFYLVKSDESTGSPRLTRLALFGGAALFFITLIFPIQFDRQWITIGWALEGAALLWLFHRVPHPGLRLVGVALLVAGFARLALNPWVISEYGRTGTPIWNWYLYTYGLVVASLMVGGWLVAAPRNQVLGTNVQPLLFSLGTVLLFFLVNIEIADFYSPPGGRLVFDFSASVEQDMTYSLAWALFAFGVVGVGFRIKNAGTRYAGVGLLVVTLAKLFLHDLWRLGGLYRVGSLVGLAVVMILLSFIYQRFLSAEAVRRNSASS
jgi:hypothetical protein